MYHQLFITEFGLSTVYIYQILATVFKTSHFTITFYLKYVAALGREL